MMGLRAFLVISLVALLVLHYLKHLWSHRRCPPGPVALPLIGSLWWFGTGISSDFFLKLPDQYGNILTIWIGYKPLIMIYGYEAVKEILIKHSQNFADRPVTPFIRAITKEKGIIFSNGHTWKQQRRFGLVTMRKLGLGKKGVEQQIQEEASNLLENFSQTKGQPFDPSMAITNAVSNVVCALVFGHRFSVDDQEFQKMIKAINAFLKFPGTIFHMLYEILPGIMKHLPGPQKEAMSNLESVLSFVKKELELHKENQILHDPRDFIDFYQLQMLKSKNSPESTYEEENLVQCIFDLFLAGTETTATTLQWALLLLVLHPDVQDKVYKEIDDVFGSSPSICYQDHKKLPYTNAVIHEIQRLKFVLVAGMPRRCMKDMNMGDFIIPEGSAVCPNLNAVLRDPKRWEKADNFYPEHFLDNKGEFVDREEFLPFGAGARICLGEQLAKIELFIFFTNLLRSFKFLKPEGVKEISQEPVQGSTVHPHPYKICAVPR